MANMLQSAQVKSTCAPSYYTDYLSKLATAGQQAQEQAQYVGAQPLQEQAFQTAAQSAGQYQPYFGAGAGLVCQASQQDIAGAAAPYIQAGTSVNPLNVLSPYAQQATRFTGYEATAPLVAQATGLSGLLAASPFLGRAASMSGACAAAQYINQATGLNATQAAQNYLSQAAGRGGLCAAQPYLCQGANVDISAAAAPYLRAVLQCSPANLAACYMNPYIDKAVKSLSDIAQRNIQQNIAPQATAAAVGSGQYGSQRGAQVLGQLTAQAEQDLNSQIANMLSTGYGQALGAAQQRQALLGQLGQTAGCMAAKQAQQALTAGQTAGSLGQQQQALLAQLGSTAGNLTAQQMQNLINAGSTQGGLTQQQAALLGQLGSTAGSLTQCQAKNLITAGSTLGSQQAAANQLAAQLGSTATCAQKAFNAAQLQAAQTAGSLTGQQAQTLNQAAQTLGNLAQTGQSANLACINALATLGGQQQTIAQNQQLFPMSTLSQLSQLLQGYNIPVSTKTTLCASPLSGLASVGSTIGGFLQPQTCGKSLWDKSLGKLLDKIFSQGCTSTKSLYGCTPWWQICNMFKGAPQNNNTYWCAYQNQYVPVGATGGLVKTGAIGCASTQSRGALPKE